MAADQAPAVLAPSSPGISVSAPARPDRVIAFLSFFAIWILWGSTYLAIRYAVATIPPLYVAGARHFIAGTILLLWCFQQRLRPTPAQWRASVVIGALYFLIGHGSLHWAEQRVPSGLAALLIATEPIWIFLISAAAAKRWRMNAILLAGIAMGLAGVALLFGGGTILSGHGVLLSAAAIIFGAISWAVGVVYSRRSRLSGHPMLLSALAMLSGSFLLITAGTLAGEWRGFSLAFVSNRSWAALAYLTIFGSLITFPAYNWLLEHYSPTLVATHTYINPIVAVLIGWLLGGEAVTWRLVSAGALVIGAVMLVDRGTRRLHDT